jgi:hypothetical protein
LKRSISANSAGGTSGSPRSFTSGFQGNTGFQFFGLYAGVNAAISR